MSHPLIPSDSPAPITAPDRAIYLGLDEGKSATRVIAMDEQGYVWGAASGPPANLAHHAPEEIMACWSRVIESALAYAQIDQTQIAGAGFGLCSLVWPSDRPALEAIVAQLGLPCPTILFDDCLMVLRAGVPQGIGIALLAGSGSGVIGRNAEGTIFRTFGSSRLGDGGGSWALSERIMEWIALSYLGTAPQISLTSRLLAAGSFKDIPALLEHFARHPTQYQRPQIMQMIFEAYEQDDEAARHLLHDLARRYVNNIMAVAKKLGFEGQPFELALSGGLFNAPRSPLVSLVDSYIHQKLPSVKLTCLRAWAAIGAALAAMDFNRFEVPEEVRLNALASGPRSLESNTRAFVQGEPSGHQSLEGPVGVD